MLIGFEFECYMPEKFYYKKDFLLAYNQFLSMHNFPIKQLGKIGYVYDATLKAQKYIFKEKYYGKEIITSALPKHLALQLMKLTFKFFKQEKIKTYQDCGFHINVNLIDKKQNQKIDYLRFLSLINQEKWLKKFNRENCIHCKSTDSVLNQDKYMWAEEATYHIKNQHTKEEVIEYLLEHSFLELLDKPTIFDKKIHAELCQSLYEFLVEIDKQHIIVEKFTETNRYFELRMVGGNNYHKRKNSILHIIREAEEALVYA